MVADLVRDDIGLRGVARGAELAVEFAEEGGVEIDALIGGAVEGTHRRLRRAAARPVLIGEEVERRPLIADDKDAPYLMRARRSVLEGQSVSARVDLGDRRFNTKIQTRKKTT